MLINFEKGKLQIDVFTKTANKTMRTVVYSHFSQLHSVNLRNISISN